MLDTILKTIQSDPGKRGLARDPQDNLLTATAGQFESASRSLNNATAVNIVTGFYIPNASPPAYETDGPLGALFLQTALRQLGIRCEIKCESPILQAISAVTGLVAEPIPNPTHVIFLERGGPGLDGRRRTMRGIDITEYLNPSLDELPSHVTTIGIGDGGNEMGMGSIAHETIVKNIANGDQIHCRVPVDHLIVAGVSNWGAYALAAGLFHLQGIKTLDGLFDPDLERERLSKMVTAGPLVDGVTGQPTATVDGLSWDEYARPLIALRDILTA